MRRVEVRMTDHDCLQPSFLVDELHSLLVQEGDQIPKHVAVGCLQQDGALADAQLLACCRGVAESRGQFSRGQWLSCDVMDTVVVLVGLEFILLAGLGGVEGGPGLALGGDVLTRVLGMLVVRVECVYFNFLLS